MNQPRHCPKCGAALPGEAMDGLCPNCAARVLFGEGQGAEPAATVEVETETAVERPGTRIGRYKLLEQIGEGGFGVVYMAEQIEPVQRKVALKIVKAGMDTREVIARFEAERQALALMDHPNIAKVLDGGVVGAAQSQIANRKSEMPLGRPYFVMELVKGIPITDFCDQKKLSPTERLQLFMTVCQAVQHAHQKGIIHRDLKPTNVLVTLHDGTPVPKVIDFGVAKALGQKLTEKTLFTGFAYMLGTPAYMSPEQAELSGLDVDTRSDIYSLGVLLYELLTGVTPLDRETLAKAALDEVRRMIRETEPSRPSTRLQTLGDKLTEVASRRHTEPPRLIHFLRGDLDWIVMKCLEKDRRRRYETANMLLMDVQRHLDDEPIVARPPSAGYRLQKLVRRNKLVFAAGSAVAAALIIGLGVSTWMFLSEKQARQRAVAAERNQERLRRQAEVAAAEAQRTAAFLGDLAESLRQERNPVKSESAYRRSLVILKRLRGSEHSATDVALSGLCYALEDQGKLEEAETLAREALAGARKSSVNDPVRIEFLAAVLANVFRHQSNYAQAELLNREALAIARQLATNDPTRLDLRIMDVADILRRQGKYAEAEPFFREALTRACESATDDPSRVRARINDLAEVLQRQGKLSEAEDTLSREFTPSRTPGIGDE